MYKPCAEIVESSLTWWQAQCWDRDNVPAFGSLMIVQTNAEPLFGIVYDIKTGSPDATRQPFAYKKTQEELLKEQPHIFTFLTTNFSCLTLGHGIPPLYQLPPHPPRIHDFVRRANDEDLKLFVEQEEYIHLIFNAPPALVNHEELLLAFISNLHQQRIVSRENLLSLLKKISFLIGHDYRRLKLFCKRLQLIIDNKLPK